MQTKRGKKITDKYNFRATNYHSFLNNISNPEEYEKINMCSNLFSYVNIWLTGAK